MMLGKKQFHVDLAGFADPRGVCENLHAFLNLVVAGGNEMVDSLHFYNADAAGTDLVDIFQIAKIGNVKTVVAAGVQDDEPQPLHGIEHPENAIQRDRLVVGVDVPLEHGVDRNHVVAAVDLHAVAGIVDDRDVGVAQRAGPGRVWMPPESD